MRVAYLECFAGISGDMLLGAMVDAGVPVEVLQRAATAVGVGAHLEVRSVDRSGITAKKVDVMEGERLAEAQTGPDEQRTTEHHHHPKTQHEHKTGHAHTHDHEHAAGHAHTHGHEHGEAHGHDGSHAHVHGRSLTEIKRLLTEATLEETVRRRAVRTFELLGASEAKIHNVPVDAIHFHEVGAVDAIVDIVCATAGFVWMEAAAQQETGEPLRWCCSPLNVGGGMVECAHGTFPVPAPATADLLRGVPTYSAYVQKELVTPTGAALVKALGPEFGPQPGMQVRQIGYGAGTRDPKGFPNVLRLQVGELTEPTTANAVKAHEARADSAATVTVLETALDDCSPQVVAHVAERLFQGGALDVMTTSVGMKKGRSGVLLTVLTEADKEHALVELLLRETTTLGVRRRHEERVCLEREQRPVQTRYGTVRMKVAHLNGEQVKAQPEFDDCRSAAEAHGVAVRTVLQAAVTAWEDGQDDGQHRREESE